MALFEDGPKIRDQTNQDIEILRTVFGESAEPGDYILMLRMEPPTLAEATFFQEKVNLVPPPLIPPVPTKYPTFTPIPSPTSTPDTTIAQTAQVNHVTETVTASAPTATYQAFLHDCAMNAWEGDFLATQTSYQEQTQKEKNHFIEKIKPLSDEPISSTAVWNGLELATWILENECSYYERCILLIFSDMDETYVDPGDNTIYLPLQDGNNKKVDVLIAMRDCQFLYSDACGKWKGFWEGFFSSRSTAASFVNENVAEAIRAVIKR